MKITKQYLKSLILEEIKENDRASRRAQTAQELDKYVIDNFINLANNNPESAKKALENLLQTHPKLADLLKQYIP